MIIYKVTNLINRKIYIGLDTKNNPSYFGSGNLIKLAIKKYGKENFTKETLEVCTNLDDLNKKEVFWIKKLQSTNKKIGYNLATGGEGRTGAYHTEKTKINMSLSRKGDKNSFFGKHFSIKSKKLLSESKKGKTLNKDNHFFGKKHSLDTKLLIANANTLHISDNIEIEILNLYKTIGINKISKKLFLGRKKIDNVLKKYKVTKRKSGPILGNPSGRKGIQLSKKHKEKISDKIKKENHPMWGVLGKKHPLYKELDKDIKNCVIQSYTIGAKITDILKKYKVSNNKLTHLLKEENIQRRGRGNYVR